MYRSTSVARVSDEYLVNLGAAAAQKISVTDDLPVYVPSIDDLPKKESSHHKLSREKKALIHLIPLLLVASFLILWLFSKPVFLHE